VHDIGKIGIPDAILYKPGRLDELERKIMEDHPIRGADLLKRHGDFARGVDIVRHHHESWDGNGYPDRLKGTAIPFGARVIAVADSFDAMTSDRPYRRGMPPPTAATILRTGRGQQWETSVVDALLKGLAELPHQREATAEPMETVANASPAHDNPLRDAAMSDDSARDGRITEPATIGAPTCETRPPDGPNVRPIGFLAQTYGSDADDQMDATTEPSRERKALA
jgi:HD domain